jgi:very-short-patch-repair endonuclease
MRGELRSLIERQHGVVTRRQLLDAGLLSGTVDRWIAAGRLHPVHRGVFAVGRAELSDRGRWLAGVLAAGPSAVLSHRSAAAFWALRTWPARLVEVSSPSGSRKPGLIAHRSLVEDTERTVVNGVCVTTVTRTLIDLAEVVPPAELERAVHQAYRLRLFDPQALPRHSGRNGAARLRRVLAGHPAGSERTRSALEVAMLALCRRHGLPAPQVNVMLEGRERDFHWPEQRLVVETDGRASHLTSVAFEDDHERDTLLMEAGYKVRRFTYRQVIERPEWVAARIRAALVA